MDPRTRLVGRSYDVIGERFDDWRRQMVGDPRDRWREELVSRLPEGARVLELGCGSGLAETQLLAKRFRVTGVDVSAAQIRRARANVHPPERNRELLDAAGFRSLLDEVVTFQEPEQEATFHWVLAAR